MSGIAYVITSSKPFALTICSAFSAISLASTAKTRFAPARAAKSDKMLVPHPTSRTVAPRKTSGCVKMNDAYVAVRTLSWIMTA